jgi:hypothetical protein
MRGPATATKARHPAELGSVSRVSKGTPSTCWRMARGLCRLRWAPHPGGELVWQHWTPRPALPYTSLPTLWSTQLPGPPTGRGFTSPTAPVAPWSGSASCLERPRGRSSPLCLSRRSAPVASVGDALIEGSAAWSAGPLAEDRVVCGTVVTCESLVGNLRSDAQLSSTSLWC